MIGEDIPTALIAPRLVFILAFREQEFRVNCPGITGVRSDETAILRFIGIPSVIGAQGKRFEKILLMWDNVKIVADWRIEKQEETRSEMPIDELTEHTTIIPEPLNHVWWRHQLHGNFLDSIHDCPHEVHEFISGRELYGLIKELDERHKEFLYYRAIRRWTPQRLAEYRGQTDRNIRGVYNRLIESLRHDMFEWLYPLYEAGEPLTLAYRKFCVEYHKQISEVREIEDE